MMRWRWSKQVDQEIDEELRAHLAMAVQDRIARGEDPADALANARREFGNELLIKEVTRQFNVSLTIERFLQDFRYSLRQMRRTPGFTALAILTLALGLGAMTAMFSVVDGVLLRPLAFHDSTRLHLVRTVPPPETGLQGDFPVNARHFHEWRNRCQACESAALVRFDELTLVGAGEPLRLPSYSVSYNFFRTLGVQPALGRDFLPEEERSMGQVLLTDSLWRNRFGADPAIVGQSIRLNGEQHLVVGVMPRDLHLPKGEEWGTLFGPPESPMIFRPIGMDTGRARPDGGQNFSSVIRFRPGVSPSQASAELNSLQAEFVQQTKVVYKVRLISLQSQVTRNARTALWLLLGTVGTVLLIVCVNIGNLMLVRTTGRQREAGVRLALGASRSQLFALVMQEALLLTLVGGMLGLALAYTLVQSFVATTSIALPRLAEIHVDGRVIAFAGMAMAFSTFACCLLPAWRLSRTEPLESLKAGGANATESGGRLRFREGMVALEVMLSTILLMVGGLLMMSFFRLLQVDKGFEATRVITQDVSFLSPKYAKGVRRQVVEDLTAKLQSIPGVTAVAAVNQLPLIGEDWVSGLSDPGQPQRPARDAALANFRFVTPDYWKVMGISLKQGRLLNDSDRDRPVVVISERAAQYLWPHQNPLGRRVNAMNGKEPREVVGVVAEVHAAGLDQPATMMVYEHYWRMQPVGMSFVLRTQSDPTAAIRSIHQILAAADPEMALQPPRTMEQILDESVAGRRFEAGLAAAFAVAALLLASLGIYGVISFAVARRTPEIGVRMALGARAGQLMAMVLREGMRPVVIGLIAGLAGSFALGRFLASELFEVQPNDPLTMAAVITLLLIVAVGACWIPARRATKVDPLLALRFE